VRAWERDFACSKAILKNLCSSGFTGWRFHSRSKHVTQEFASAVPRPRAARNLQRYRQLLAQDALSAYSMGYTFKKCSHGHWAAAKRPAHVRAPLDDMHVRQLDCWNRVHVKLNCAGPRECGSQSNSRASTICHMARHHGQKRLFTCCIFIRTH
jgi:hypothetical protein